MKIQRVFYSMVLLHHFFCCIAKTELRLNSQGKFSFPSLLHRSRLFNPRSLTCKRSLSIMSSDIGEKEPPATMLAFIKSKLLWGLEHWHSDFVTDDELASYRDKMATKLVGSLLKTYEDNSKQGNKRLYETGMSISKALHAAPASLDEISNGSIEINEILQRYRAYLEKNRAVFSDITKHHESLVHQPWEEAVTKTNSLRVYANAANAMGQKAWVREANSWMESFAIGFFRRNGARKEYLRSVRSTMSPEKLRELFESLPRDLMMTSNPTIDSPENLPSSLTSGSCPQKIRILDVGSCYNPIAKSVNADAFEVVALDLCPADPSVYQCDFLGLTVGERGTELVVESGTETGAERKDSAKLLQLPAESFDAVTMSLVLSYLPSPKQREDMIRKARELLVPPGYGGQPHRAGLLLIIEKESIFSYDLVNQVDSHKDKSGLLNCWKEAICNCGFELLKYRNLQTSQDSRRCHAFVFRTAAIPPNQLKISTLPLGQNQSAFSIGSATGDEMSSDRKEIDATMWIKQDFTTSSVNSSSKTGTEPRSTKLLESVVYSLQSLEEKRSGGKIPKIAHDFVEIRNNNTINDISGGGEDRGDSMNLNNPTADAESVAQQGLPVAVVGGGLGGTALALALQTRGLPVKIFEKDDSFSSRRQGYALTIQQGIITLRMIGLGIIEKLTGGEEGAGLHDVGLTSLAHESFTAEGRLLGAYGAGTRGGRRNYIDNEVSGAIGHTEDVNVRSDGVGFSSDTSSNSGSETDIVIGNPLNRKLPKRKRQVSNEDADSGQHGRKNIHVPRQRLRHLLMHHIAPENVCWNKRLTRFEEVRHAAATNAAAANSAPELGLLSSDAVRLFFDDGSEFLASVLVGADGIHSTVRKQLFAEINSEGTSSKTINPDNKGIGDSVASRGIGGGTGLQYLNLMVILGISPMVLGSGGRVIYRGGAIGDREKSGTTHVGEKRKRSDENEEKGKAVVDAAADSRNVDTATPEEIIRTEVEKDGGRRQLQWLDGTTRVFTMPYDYFHTMWQLSFPISEEAALQLSGNADELKAEALRRVAGWHAPLVELLSATDREMMSGHPAYDREPLQPQEYSKGTFQSRVTLMGDAAHPMSPFKAQGANQALLDARSLTRALVSSDFGRPGRGRRPVTEALRSYEREMCARSAVKVLRSRAAASYLHSPAALVEGNVTRAFAAESKTVAEKKGQHA